MITYLAEGATGAFFDTRLALANPNATQALVLTRFQKGDGTTISDYRVIPPFSRTTIDVETLAGLEAAEFSTLVEADVQVVADRTMTWDSTGYGSHAERGILTRTATKWYFAEGATFGPFNLFYLVQNPNAQAAQVTVTYLLGAGAPLVKQYTIPAAEPLQHLGGQRRRHRSGAGARWPVPNCRPSSSPPTACRSSPSARCTSTSQAVRSGRATRAPASPRRRRSGSSPKGRRATTSTCSS